ncbi:Isopenicillin N epimerase component 1 like protein [Verticillium longisporum]|nr:Isopenicillin N epimerase component 1 like protein [Verticillium longisporum]
MGMNLAIVEVDHEQGAPWRDPKTGFCRSAGTNEPGELLCRVSPTDMSRRFQGYYAIGSHPAVREANVYGVELPHHDGRAGCAALVLDEGRGIEAKPEDALLKSLAEHVKKALPKYALPLFLRVMPDMGMQMTGTNKQQKTGLRGEGVKPGAGDESLMYWLQGDTYVPFTAHDWQQLDVLILVSLQVVANIAGLEVVFGSVLSGQDASSQRRVSNNSHTEFLTGIEQVRP